MTMVTAMGTPIHTARAMERSTATTAMRMQGCALSAPTAGVELCAAISIFD